MNDIERLFGGDRPVPGMRTTGRFAPPAAPEKVERPGALAEEPIDVKVERELDEPVQAPPTGRTAAPAEGAIEVDLSAPAAPRDSDAESEVRAGDQDADAERFIGPAAGGITEQLRASLVDAPIRGKPARQLHFAHDSAHAHSERVRLLRTELLLRHTSRDGGAAIAVLSAGAGDGRSQLAAELALAFAQLERPTLLVDADMRGPSQHLLFGVPLGTGLAHVIAQGSSPNFIDVEGWHSLSVLTAGACPANPLELLSDGRFDSLMTQLRGSFEFIVIDTPRFSDYADGLAIATVVGHVLTVHRAKRTQYKSALNMLRQLTSARAEILGGVVNHF